MYTFYHAPGSSSMAVLIALHEVGAKFEIRMISLADHALDPAEFATLNPERKVPTLLINGRPLTEVAGILYYLSKAHPNAALFPSGNIEAEASVVSWMSFIASTLHPARRQGLDYARAIYRLADQRLGHRDWAAGNAYSIAGIHLFRLFWRFRTSLGADPALFPNLSAHQDRMLERPAVQKALAADSASGFTLPA